jgi:PAS domain-containing protein
MARLACRSCHPGVKAMSELQEFSALVGDIYDASLDPPLWSGVLEKLTRFVSGRHANIFVENSARQATDMTFSWGDDPHYQKLYREKYARINPLFPASLFYDVEEIFAVSDVIPPARFCRTRFYKEWLAPQGVLDAVVGVLEKSRTSCAMLAVPRHHQSQGFVDKKTRERMRLVVPHVRRAILVGKTIDLQKANAATLADAFDAVSAAVYLVDKRGRIVHANRGGIALLAKDDIMLRGAGDRLRARDPAIDRILQEIFASAEAEKDLSVGSKGTAIPLTGSDGERYAAHVLPLRCTARRPARGPPVRLRSRCSSRRRASPVPPWLRRCPGAFD